MAHLHDATDRDLESLLRGELPDDPDALGRGADVVIGLRVSALAEPVPPMSDQLRDQLAATASVPALPRRLMLRAGAKALGGAAAVATLVSLVGAGAATSRLPTTVHNAVSAAAGLVGVDVPRADEQADMAAGQPAVDGGLTAGGSLLAEPGAPAGLEPAIPAIPPDDAGAAPGTGSGTGPTDRSNDRPDDPRVSPDPATATEEPVARPSAPRRTPPLGNATSDRPEPRDDPSRDRSGDQPAADGEEIEERPADADADDDDDQATTDRD